MVPLGGLTLIGYWCDRMVNTPAQLCRPLLPLYRRPAMGTRQPAPGERHREAKARSHPAPRGERP